MKPTSIFLLFMSMTLNSGLAASAPTITVPLLDDDISFRVPVRMFGETNYFLVDTGTSATALDLRFSSRLGESVRRWDGHDFYRAPQIMLQDTALPVREVLCLDLKMFRMITGEPCDGILGMDFLGSHVQGAAPG